MRPLVLRAFVNAFKVPDLRNKILFTLLIIAVYRFGSHVPVPVIDIRRAAATFDAAGPERRSCSSSTCSRAAR